MQGFFSNIFKLCSKRKKNVIKDEEQAILNKQIGNEKFKNLQFNEALNSYSLAIDFSAQNKFQAICYSNRAFCHIKLESYGLALQDAQKAINLDPSYIKSYYREGSAFLLLSKLEKAKESFQKVNKLTNGKDTDIQEKLKQVKQLIFENEFQKSISTDQKQEQQKIDLSQMIVSQDYKGPSLEMDQEITPCWVDELMEYQKNQKNLDKKSLTILLLRVKEIFKQQNSLVYFNFPDDIEMTVCGDIHGQYYDLLNIFKLNGNPSDKKPYLFNGDFVDRGSFSAEVIITLLAWKLCNPQNMHLTRGNHETVNMNQLYGFEGEILSKYDANIFGLFTQIFQHLPLVYILNNKVQVNHGGLFEQDGVTLADIEKIDRVKEPPEQGLMTDILWSDPVKINGRHPSKRGVSIGFGPDIAHRYLDQNNLVILVRSHEMKQQGYEVEAQGRVITIFSAPNYCDQMGNQGAFIKFLGKDMKPKFQKFSAVPHPKVAPMSYSRGFSSLF